MNGTLIQPSWDLGYATGPDESEFPDLWEGLEGYWSTGLGVTGLDLFDTVGGHHGTLTNMVAATDWVVDPESGLWVLDYDGGNDHLNMGDSNNMGTSDITISAWIKIPNGDTSRSVVLNKHEDGTINPGILIEIGQSTAGKARLLISDGAVSVAELGDTNWNNGILHLLTAVFDRDGNALLYRDGIPLATLDISSSSGSIDNARDFFIGHNGSVAYFTGQIGDTGMWGRVLVQQEIAGLAAGDSPLTPKLEILGKAPVAGISIPLIMQQMDQYSGGAML